MTPVFFNGYGEWFIEDCFGDSHRINELGGYFLMPEDDKDHFLRWQLFDAFHRYYERLSPSHIAGDFRLTDKDERKYLDHKAFLVEAGFKQTNNELAFVDRLLPLLPLSSIDCAFSSFAAKRGISLNDSSRCYFQIAKGKDFKLYEFEIPNSPIASGFSKNTGLIQNHKSSNSINEKRLESLKQFIEWLSQRTSIDKNHLDCTKEELFDLLKSWEKDRETQKNKRVWNVKGWESCGDFWRCEKRKQVCDIADDRRGRKIESPYKKLFS